MEMDKPLTPQALSEPPNSAVIGQVVDTLVLVFPFERMRTEVGHVCVIYFTSISIILGSIGVGRILP